MSEVQKQWKANVWNLDVDEEKTKLFFLQQMRACAREVIFFTVKSKKYGKKSFMLKKNKFEKLSLWSTIVWNLDLGQNLKIQFFFKNCMLAP